MTAPQTIDTDALRKLCEVPEQFTQDYEDWAFRAAEAWSVKGPAILDELDRLRAAEAASKARDLQQERDAQRYRKLRSIGAAPNGTSQLGEGLVLVAQILDDWVDKTWPPGDDLRTHAVLQKETASERKPNISDERLAEIQGRMWMDEETALLSCDLVAARAEIARLTDAGTVVEKVARKWIAERMNNGLLTDAARHGKELSKAILDELAVAAPPPPAAADRGVPRQRVSDVELSYFLAADPWCCDMSRAPRDGTRVLLFFRKWINGGPVRLGAFDASVECWRTTSGSHEFAPDAWMYLPAAPARQQEEPGR